jgi:hypothetical protein
MNHQNDWLRSRQASTRVVALGILIAAMALVTAGCAGPTDAARPAASATPSATSQSVVPSVPAPTPVVAAHLARSKPVRLQIPAIGVDSTLMDLGLNADGTMQVPPQGFPAGWYTGSPTPGELGPAIIAGHVDWTGPGVFYNLRKLRPDDTVSVTREDGSVASFRVTRVEQFAKDKFPTDLVYGNIDFAGLRLITCSGSWNKQTHHYEDNIVVFADLVAPGS